MNRSQPPHRPQLAAHARYRWDTIRGEHQLVFPEGLLVLNETGAAIVKRCDGRLLAALVESLEEDYKGGSKLTEVAEFLSKLVERGLVYDVGEPNEKSVE